jgi:hypothetical protein
VDDDLSRKTPSVGGDRRSAPVALLLLLGSLGGLACSKAPVVTAPRVTPPQPAAHFFDADGKPIAAYETAWPYLTAYFGGAVPSRITVLHQATGTSHFVHDQDIIYISASSLHGVPEPAIVAHETAHRALAVLSGGASAQEPFRFMDEGLAMILQKQVVGTLPAYRRAALVLAAQRLTTGSVRLADMQAWSRYFGDASGGSDAKLDWNAYLVGSAFDFFVEDTYGEGALKRLFADLAKTRSLAASTKTVFGRTLDETEAAWVAYLRAVDLATVARAPTVVEMMPANGATGVATELPEIHVTFDTDMVQSICVNAPCSAGICYDHAHWKDSRTLAIRIDRPLMPDHLYSLALGSPPQCTLKSSDRIDLPVTRWEFRTR